MAPGAEEVPGFSTPAGGSAPRTPPEDETQAATPAREAEAYTRFVEGSKLLDTGNPHAAIVALERARELEPDKGSVREALGRAYFRSGRIGLARIEFEKLVELDPVNDYAHFGLGRCLLRTGDRDGALRHLKLATVMRPEAEEYRDALRQASGSS